MNPATIELERARLQGEGGDAVATPGLRIGVDVGGTFTKAVAIEDAGLGLRAQAVVSTSHDHDDGVMAGVVEALSRLLAELGSDRERVGLVAFSTTQAMNALLEGDVPRVGIVGIGEKPDLRRARKRTRVGSIELAPGRALETVHEFIDASAGLDPAAAAAAVDRLVAAGCGAVAVSGSYSVDSPEQELTVAELVTARGLAVCCGHELSGAYGLEIRTVSAAINAAIVPVVERTAGLVERALAEAGLDVPLLVLRGDGGAMDVAAFRRRPSFTVGSGPAAGVAAALHRADAADAIVVEVGGTSTNVSAVVRGRPILRSIRVMGRPTAIRSIDSWVVGVAGGSMIRLGRKKIVGAGPRSAHLAGLEYACFAEPDQLADATVELISPRAGDPATYVTLVAGGARWALTATCAANALGWVPEGAHAHGSREAALAAFARLADRIGHGDAERAAREALRPALDELIAAVRDAASCHDIGPEVPLLALGGAGEALVPQLASELGRPLLMPEHQEVLASIGAATTLVRAEVTRSSLGEDAAERTELVLSAERDCVDAGAAPETVSVETTYDTADGVLRAVATGAVALEHGAAGRTPADLAQRAAAAAAALEVPGAEVRALSNTDFYGFYTTGPEAMPRVAIVDRLGSVPVLADARAVVVGTGAEFERELAAAINAATTNLGIASVIPQVAVVCGPRLLDLSDSRRPEDLLAAVAEIVATNPGEAAAAVLR